MERRTVRVERAMPNDLPELSAVVARAFEDDPMYGWLLPDAASRVAKNTALNMALFPRLLSLEFFEMYTTPERSGVAIWAGPERWEPPTRLMLGALPRLIRTLGFTGLAKMGAAMGDVRKAHPKEPHYYLMGLATDPPCQRTGIGTALTAPVLERCDRDRVGAYLETQKSENVPYYERFGFRVTNEIDLSRDGPHLWLMWRDPH